MKIGIISYDTRIDNEAINNIKKINEEYAKIHNYKFIYEIFDINSINYDWEDLRSDDKNHFKLKVFCHKAELIEKYLNDFDYIVYIDSDACFSNPTIKIEDLIDNEHDFFISQDNGLLSTTVWQIYSSVAIQNYLQKIKKPYLQDPEKELKELSIFEGPILEKLRWITCNPSGFNTGFFIVKSSDIIKKFFIDFKKYYPIFEENSYDQGCISNLLRTIKYKNILKILPLNTQGNPFFEHPDFIYKEDETFICHYYALKSDIERLLNHIKLIKNNKWWTKFKREN